MPCRFPGPHPRGSLRGLAWEGVVSRPTPRGKVEGSDLGGSPGPHPGEVEGSGRGVSRLTPGGVSQHALRQTPSPDGYCCGLYASYRNAFLFVFVS